MIIGIGVDIIDIKSFTESFNKSKRFRQRVFTENEIAYCESKPNKFQHYAARFAAKEAVMKAIGTGWSKGIQWTQIETINNGKENQQLKNDKRDMNGGKPEIRLSGKTLERSKDMGVDNIHISLSHSETQVIAFVVLENHK
ncbi:MAG: holo-ACP synthase [Bacteroidales bacterium]|nr:holo-ACP synthase [Bacteroidales bacterium]